MLRRRRIVAVGFVLLLGILAAALFAPQLAPHNPLALDVPARLAPPGPGHPCGTDEFGRDILSRTLYGARLSLAVGALVTTLATTAGIAVGLVAGTNRGADRVQARFTVFEMANGEERLPDSYGAARGLRLHGCRPRVGRPAVGNREGAACVIAQGDR